MNYFAHAGHDHELEAATQANGGNPTVLFIGLGLIALAVIIAVVFTRRSAKQDAED